MDRTLWLVGGGAMGCGLLLALAVARNERSFNDRFHAQAVEASHQHSEERAPLRAVPAPAPEPRPCAAQAAQGKPADPACSPR